MKMTLRKVKSDNAHCRGPLCPSYHPTIIPRGTMALEIGIRSTSGTAKSLYCPKCTEHLVGVFKTFIEAHQSLNTMPPAALSKYELILGDGS